jgi:hypothetical protein
MIHAEDKDMMLGAIGAMLLLPLIMIAANYYSTFTIELVHKYSPPVDYSINPWE